MARNDRPAIEIERPDGQADVLLVRRVTRPGPAVSIHGPGARHWTAIYTFAGRRTFPLRGVDFVAAPDTLLVYRRDDSDRRSLKEPEAWDAMTACFDRGPDWSWSPTPSFERIADETYCARVAHEPTRQRIRDAFGRLLGDEEARIAARAFSSIGATGSGGAAALDEAVLRQLMLTTLQEILLLAGSDRLLGLDPRIRTALDTMAADLGAAHTLHSLGLACDLSPSGFAHLFRAELGVSPIRALRVMRLRHAALQLRYTNDSVERISEATGFTSASHLSREFRRYFGVPPRAYRAATGLPSSG